MDGLKTLYEEMMSYSEEIVDDEISNPKNLETTIKEKLRTQHDVMKDQGIEGVKRLLRANTEEWMNTPLHIAVTGRSGVGKSAFINALRNVEAEDKGAAQVGVKETTTKLTPYAHPHNPNLIVWDMPGVGTPKFPKENYLQCAKLEEYDFFFIVSKDRFTEEDLWLAKQIQEQNKRFYFIRSHIDVNIGSDKRAHPRSHSPDKVFSTVREDCSENLVKAGIESPMVFLVDSHDRQSYEFGLLEAQLLRDSDSIKMEAMALSLSTLTVEVLQKKREVLESTTENIAMVIACEDSFSNQKKIFENEIKFYMKQFNLDYETLQDNAVVLLSMSKENIEELETFVYKQSKTAEKGLSKARSNVTFFRRLFRYVMLLREIWFDSFFKVFKFSCLSLKQNLDELFRMALNAYGVDAHKGLVQSVMGKH